jgi:DNA-binding HxlR family transcriptional regulator
MAIAQKYQQQISSIFSGACSQQKLCPVKDIMASYGDKWSIYTILLLGQHQRMRFNELRFSIEGISQRMLTVTLRSLEEDGMILRTLYSEMPPRVEYQLTELGESLLRQLLSLAKWAEDHFSEIINARKKYRRRHPAS